MHVLIAVVVALFCSYWNPAWATSSTPTSASASTPTASGQAQDEPLPANNFNAACQALAGQLPHAVAFPGSSQYDSDILHFYHSSQQNSTCSVEPHTQQDVQTILRFIAKERVPFAVKGGGHAYDLGQSSTPGIQISMARFSAVTYHPSNGTVDVGTGLPWDEVYARLEPFGVTVAGGRIPGIGVSGLSLGGGYSWKTNQVGLTVDTIIAHDAVLPTGEIQHVTNQSNPDLFFALKGGLNNFGIVTSITYRALPQTQVWGGSLVFADNNTALVHNATATFDFTNTDPKAQLLTTYATIGGQFISSIALFYDAPVAPAGTFDEFLSIPGPIMKDIQTRNFTTFLTESFGNGTLGIGPIFNIAQHCIPVLKYTVPILQSMENTIKNTTSLLTARFPNTPAFVVSISPEPFLNPNAHSTPSAFPHPADRPITPASPFIAWVPTAGDPVDQGVEVEGLLKDMTNSVHGVAIEQGQSRANDLLYPNYALSGTPLELIYGQNLAQLRVLARKFDPEGVMTLTGGFKLQ